MPNNDCETGEVLRSLGQTGIDTEINKHNKDQEMQNAEKENVFKGADVN